MLSSMQQQQQQQRLPTKHGGATTPPSTGSAAVRHATTPMRIGRPVRDISSASAARSLPVGHGSDVTAALLPLGHQRGLESPPCATDAIADDIILGKGSFSVVYRGMGDGQVCAVKVIDKGKLHRKLMVRLYQEIDILKRLSHPHIVHLFGIDDTEQQVRMRMEFCDMGDLSSFIKRYPTSSNGNKRGLPEQLTRSFSRQLGSALSYLSLHHIIHRDLKPHNILLSRSLDGNPFPLLKLADFGFARRLTDGKMADTLCGSPLYMAPEILRYEPYDARADLWSFGIILYEMMTGRPPFRAANHIALMKRIQSTSFITFPDESDHHHRSGGSQLPTPPLSSPVNIGGDSLPSSSSRQQSLLLSNTPAMSPSLQGPRYAYDGMPESLPRRIDSMLHSGLQMSSSTDADLRDLVRQCLQKDVSKRIEPVAFCSHAVINAQNAQCDHRGITAPDEFMENDADSAIPSPTVSFPPQEILSPNTSPTESLAGSELPLAPPPQASAVTLNSTPIDIKQPSTAQKVPSRRDTFDTLTQRRHSGANAVAVDDHHASSYEAPFAMDDDNVVPPPPNSNARDNKSRKYFWNPGRDATDHQPRSRHPSNSSGERFSVLPTSLPFAMPPFKPPPPLSITISPPGRPLSGALSSGAAGRHPSSGAMYLTPPPSVSPRASGHSNYGGLAMDPISAVTNTFGRLLRDGLSAAATYGLSAVVDPWMLRPSTYFDTGMDGQTFAGSGGGGLDEVDDVDGFVVL